MTKEEAIQKEVSRDRWSDGTAHHPTSIEALRFISELDSKAYGGHFDWRVGGDGDNGETLAYQLDAFFEFKDSQGMVPAAQVEKLEAEIAELRQKQASDQMWIIEISNSVKAGLWEPFLQSSLSAGIVHGRSLSTSRETLAQIKELNADLEFTKAQLESAWEMGKPDLEREARIEKLVEALEWYADEDNSTFIPTFLPNGHWIVRAPKGCCDVARQALAEYRSGEGEK